MSTPDRRDMHFEPGRLWSLWDMRVFDAYRFMAISNFLGSHGYYAPEHDAPVPEQYKAENIPALQSYLPTLADLAMTASFVSMQRLISTLSAEDCRWSHLSPIAQELHGRLVDESQHRQFFAMSLKETSYFTYARGGWESAIDRFENIIDDIEEAGRCLALSRFPASVYHSVQIAEIGLIELGKFLRVTDPQSGWSAVSQALDKVVAKKHSERTTFEKKHFAFLEQLQGTVLALKNAWRNKISHVQGRLVVMGGDFSPDTAEEIFIATRAFMRRLAEGLPPRKLKKGELRGFDAFANQRVAQEGDFVPDEDLVQAVMRDPPDTNGNS